MQSFSVMEMPIANSLGASGYPALQTLYNILNRKSRFFLFSSGKFYVVLATAAMVEMLEELF